MNRLTVKQRKFVDAYVNNGGNGVDAVIDADGGSLPDDRSRRNVRNRFPDRGLPERAFWLGEGFRADQREHHDRRFGRYYDDDGNLNDRGRLVNEQLRIEREAEAGAC
mgnify:CR=1 FL=1